MSGMKNIADAIKNSLNRLNRLNTAKERMANTDIKIFHNKILRGIRGDTIYSVNDAEKTDYSYKN